jgi:tetratricopeptide (TPR) repeat protein
MSRVDFVFDRVPRFEVNHSGQRVRVEMRGAIFAESLEPGSRRHVAEPLVRVKTGRTGAKSYVDLYFRAVPEFVDVTVDEAYARLSVNVFFSEEQVGSRPGIIGKRVGRLRPIEGGAAAARVVASDYSGNWERFFEEFEWSPEIHLPLHFSFPRFPSPMMGRNAHLFPQEVKSAGAAGKWEEAGAHLRSLIEKEAGGRQAELFRLLLAECLLRQEKPLAAIDILEVVTVSEDVEEVYGWKTYFKAYALSLREKHFEALRLVEMEQERCQGIKGLAPWFRLLQAELALAVGKPEQAAARLDAGKDPVPEWLAPLYNLRRADAFSARKRAEEALSLYSQAAAELRVMRRHPRALAAYAALLYEKGAYGKSFRHYFLLSEALRGENPEARGLSDYWSANARLHAGEPDRARLVFWELEEEAAFSEGGSRARLKLMDMDRMGGAPGEVSKVREVYEEIIERGPNRQVREEALFKLALAEWLSGESLCSVKLLGRFFNEFWAGALLPEAQALLVDIFPEAVRVLVKQEAYFEALTLVAKYRDLLAQARIDYGFLFDLAESYEQAGFVEQAAAAYQFVLDFEDSAEKRRAAYLPLIRLYHREKEHERVLRYGSDYLSRYPGVDNGERGEALYYYADVLLKRGELEALRAMLDETARPKTAGLDFLAGEVFSRLGRNDLAEYYLTWAADAEGAARRPEIRARLAEVLFFDGQLDKAAAVYETLLEEPRFAGRAGYRLILIYLETGRKTRALNVYRALSEKEVAGRWRDLAAETVQLGRMDERKGRADGDRRNF